MWCLWQGLNQRQLAYETNALPTELLAYKNGSEYGI